MRARLSHYQFIAVASQTPHSTAAPCSSSSTTDQSRENRKLYGIYHAHGGGGFHPTLHATAMWAPETAEIMAHQHVLAVRGDANVAQGVTAVIEALYL